MVASARAAEDKEITSELRAVYSELIPLLLKAQPLVARLAAAKEKRPSLDVYVWPDLQPLGEQGPFFRRDESVVDYVIRSVKAYGWYRD